MEVIYCMLYVLRRSEGSLSSVCCVRRRAENEALSLFVCSVLISVRDGHIHDRRYFSSPSLLTLTLTLTLTIPKPKPNNSNHNHTPRTKKSLADPTVRSCGRKISSTYLRRVHCGRCFCRRQRHRSRRRHHHHHQH